MTSGGGALGRGTRRATADGRDDRGLRGLFVLQDADRWNRLLNALVDRLGDVRLEVVMFDDDGAMDDDLREGGVVVHHLPLQGRSSAVGVVRALRRLLREFDVVQSNGYVPSLLVELARASTWRSTPSILARHYNREHLLLGHRRAVWLDRVAARRASRVLAVSAAIRDTLVEEGLSPSRITVVPNGMDWAVIAARPDAVQAWRARFPNRRLAVAVGRIDPIKDYGTLLSAFALARDTHPDIHLLLAGLGSESAIAAMERSVAELARSVSVTVLGWVNHVLDLVTAPDVFVQASANESFGQSVLEPAVVGAPLAVTMVGGVVDLLAGIHPPVPPRDPVALGRRICEVVADGSRGTVPVAHLHRLRAQFGAGAMLNGHLSLWREVHSSAHRRRAVG
jgi:glycosyltransferase involved in cell wall biosynthesis